MLQLMCCKDDWGFKTGNTMEKYLLVLYIFLWMSLWSLWQRRQIVEQYDNLWFCCPHTITNRSPKNRKSQQKIHSAKKSQFWKFSVPSLIARLTLYFSRGTITEYFGLLASSRRQSWQEPRRQQWLAGDERAGSLPLLQPSCDSPAACLEGFSQFYLPPAGSELNRQECSKRRDGIPEGNKFS